jgi:hypothetical protein
MSQLNYGPYEASNDRGNWNHVKIVHKTSGPYRLTWKARHLDTTENGNIRYTALISGSANVTVQNIQRSK